MPPARPTSAAAEETVRRTRGGAASQRGRHRSDVGISPPSGEGAAGGQPTPVEGNVDWDAIFRTIDGQAGAVPGQRQGEEREGQQPRDRPSSLQQGYDYPSGFGHSRGSTSMSAGPSSSRHPPHAHFPSLFEEPRRNAGPGQPWSPDHFPPGFGGLESHRDSLPFGNDGPASRGPSPQRPPQPNRSQSYPFYNDPFHQAMSNESAEHHNAFDPQTHQFHGFMPPPPPGLASFGLSSHSEPTSFGSASGPSIASLLNQSNPYPPYMATPLASPALPLPDHPLPIPRTFSNMDPPPQSSHRGHPSISHNPIDYSGQSSVNPSPAPTPLSNPTSGEDSEDKRVRNTVASAKFRAKKKEQIANVQRTITDLEGQQAALEADVASLRNENGLLREMVQIKYGTKIPEK